MKKHIILLFILIQNIVLVYSQEFKVQKLSDGTIDKHLNRNNFASKYQIYKKQAFDVGKIISKEKKNFDLTDEIQGILNKHKVVLLPNYSIKISDKGLRLNDGQVLLFQEKTILKLIPSAKSSYSILKIEEVDNVVIFNANIVGDKYEHLGTTGQWGFGIDVKSSNNVNIYSPYIKETWGDGIYIGQIKNIPSTNVNIYNAVIDNVRRNGISITSANGVSINNSYISNTNGNSPESAIDIEPNSINDEIKNIQIKELNTFNNKWAGVLLVFEQFKSTKQKEVSVIIDGHIDVNSRNGIAFHGYLNDNETKNLKGMIKLKDISYKNNKVKYFFYKTNLSLLDIQTSIKTLKSQFNNHKVK